MLEQKIAWHVTVSPVVESPFLENQSMLTYTGEPGGGAATQSLPAAAAESRPSACESPFLVATPL